jgi:hypothetical protein
MLWLVLTYTKFDAVNAVHWSDGVASVRLDKLQPAGTGRSDAYMYELSYYITIHTYGLTELTCRKGAAPSVVPIYIARQGLNATGQ